MRYAFKMQLFPGKAIEYKRRHDEIWPELVQLLKAQGISNYMIFLDEATGALFAAYDLAAPPAANLADHPVMKKWWDHMADIMETNTDHSPVVTPLSEMFFLK